MGRYTYEKSVKVKCYASKYVGETDVASTIMARDYKGFGNQDATAIIDIRSDNNDLTDKASN